MDSLPLTNVGKINKKRLREDVAVRLTQPSEEQH